MLIIECQPIPPGDHYPYGIAGIYFSLGNIIFLQRQVIGIPLTFTLDATT